MGELKEAEKHVRVDCMWTEVACPNQCGQRVLPRCKLNQHATEECPRHPRQCDFAGMGCDSGALTPGKLHDHMQENVQQHLTLVCKKLEETEFHEALKMSELEALVLARDMRIMELEGAVQVHETNPGAGELEAAAMVYETRLGELETVVQAREARIAELEATVQVREARELEARVEARQAEVKELVARVQDREARMKQLETSVQVRNERIKELESTTEAQEAKISELDTMVKTRNARIQKFTVEIQANETKLGKVEALLQDRDGKIRILETVVDASEAKVEELNVELQARDVQIQELGATLEARGARIRRLEAIVQARDTRIQELEATVQELQTRIGELEAAAQTQEARVAKLENKVKARDSILFLIGAVLLVISFVFFYAPLIAKKGISTSTLTEVQRMYEQYISPVHFLTQYDRGTEEYTECCEALVMVSSDIFWSFVVMVSMVYMRFSGYGDYPLLVFIAGFLCLYVWILFRTSCFYCLTPFIFSFGSNLSFWITTVCIKKKLREDNNVLLFLVFCIYVTVNTFQSAWLCPH